MNTATATINPVFDMFYSIREGHDLFVPSRNYPHRAATKGLSALRRPDAIRRCLDSPGKAEAEN
jgi:hypothetical protein